MTGRLLSAILALSACGSEPSRLDGVSRHRAPPPSVPAPPGAHDGELVVRDFHFRSGESLPELRLHYTTIGTLARDAAGHATNAVLLLHATTGSVQQLFGKPFAGELFGPGQPLDTSKYFVILTDAIGHGASSKPSDGLHARFPHYGYHDMVAAEHAVVASLGVDHLRLVMGTSMGCMHSWMWAETWPDMMDAVMPLACLPVAIAGRNRQWRKAVIDGIETDPDWQGGDYEREPERALRLVADIFVLTGANPLERQRTAPTAAAADEQLATRVQRFIATADANDVLYAVAASADYDPSPDLEKIQAHVMFVNSADDYLNPPELGIAEREIKRVAHGTFVLVPQTDQTMGHGTHTWAVFWKDKLVDLLAATAK